MARTLLDLETPELVLDRKRFERNIARMADRTRALGIALRPHLKTPKSLSIANRLKTAGAKGFCVSTLKEAEYFFAGGLNDFYYCVPIAPNKMARAAALVARGCKLTLVVDSVDGADSAISAAREASFDGVLDFTVEIDVDGYRTGAPLDGDEIIEIAGRFESSALTHFVGLMSYAGQSYNLAPAEAGDLAHRHAAALAAVKDRLGAAGMDCPIVSLGSTPAVLHARRLAGVTEARCGIYAFQDLFQAGIGACAQEDVALSVLTSVIGRQARYNRIVIDAGGLALSKDRSTADRSFDALYGIVCDAEAGAPISDLVVMAVSQELGLVASKSGAPLDMDAFPVGRLLRILPNHADMTAAAYEKYVVVDGGAEIKDVWERTNHWE